MLAIKADHQETRVESRQRHSPFWAEDNEVIPAIAVEVSNDWFANWLARQ